MEKIKSALQLTLEAEGWELLGNTFKFDQTPIHNIKEIGLKISLNQMLGGRLGIDYYTSENDTRKIQLRSSQQRVETELKKMGIREIKFGTAYDPNSGKILQPMYAV